MSINVKENREKLNFNWLGTKVFESKKAPAAYVHKMVIYRLAITLIHFSIEKPGTLILSSAGFSIHIIPVKCYPSVPSSSTGNTLCACTWNC